VTAVSRALKHETERAFDYDGAIDVIHNFFAPRRPRRSREDVREELGLGSEVVVVHSSNLRPGKRIDLLLETAARVRAGAAWKLLVLAGESFAPFADDVRRLGLRDRIIVREKVNDIEEYLQIGDIGLYTPTWRASV
jgi:glycosyltransferase involved in cell wall biosynthesis